MFHYLIIHIDSQEVILDSRRRVDFDGFLTKYKAHMAGVYSRIDNMLSPLDYYVSVIPA